MNEVSERQLPDEAAYFRYRSTLAPRVVEVPETDLSCRLLPPPVQIVRGVSADQQAAIERQKPPYLLLKFGELEHPSSTPFADLSSLG